MTTAFSFLLSVLFVPGISGAGTAPRWAFAAVVLPLLIPRGKANFTAAHLCGLIFIWYAAITVTWSHPYDGLDALIKLIVIAEAFVLGTKLPDLKPVIIGFGLGMWVNSAILLLGIEVPHTSDSPAGLFVNSNSLGEIAGLVLVAAASARVWWLIPGILPALILSHSRGALAAVAGAFVIWLWQRSRLAAIALGGLGIVAIALSGSSGSIHDRLVMWTDVLPHVTVMGHGLGSFYTLYPTFGTIDTLIQRPEHLHNDWLEYLFETGIGSVFLGAGVLSIIWRSKRQDRLDGSHSAIILAALAIEACFGFPTHVAATAVLGGLVAGHAVRGRADIRDLFDAWRDGLRGWYENVSIGAVHRSVTRGGADISAG